MSAAAGLSPTAIRTQLRRAGYTPTPVSGKDAVLKEWQKKTETNDVEIGLWATSYPWATNTGVLTRNIPALDIDLTYQPAAEAIEDLARERFEERGYLLVRIGKAPKRAILCRTDTPFAKQTLYVWTPDGKREAIEILGDGQQVVVHGVHPGTERPYRWHGGEPWRIPADDLPYISAEIAREFLADAAKVLAEQGYRVSQLNKPAAGGFDECRGPLDWWPAAFERVLSGESCHSTVVQLAASFAASATPQRVAYRVLRGLIVNAYPAGPDRERLCAAELSRLSSKIATAYQKYGVAEALFNTLHTDGVAALERMSVRAQLATLPREQIAELIERLAHERADGELLLLLGRLLS